MQMHRHDLDIVAAFADGSLEDEDRARALIQDCVVCRAEYDSQRALLAELASLGPASMTDVEKAALHRDVLTALAPGTRSVPNDATPSWLRWGYSAAGLILVVSVVGLVNRAGFSPTSEEAARSEASGSFFSGDDGAQAGADATVAAATQTTTAGAAAAPESDATGGAELDPLSYMAMVEEARANIQADPSVMFSDDATAQRAKECLARAGLESGYRVIGDVDESARFLLAIPPVEAFTAETPITVVDFDTCMVVDVDP